MTPLIFIVVAFFSGLFTAFEKNISRAILALWLTGLSVGCLYLSLGAEVLAIIQWVLSTILALAFVYFSVMFGEFSNKTKNNFDEQVYSRRKFFLKFGLSLLVALGFLWLTWLASKKIPMNHLIIPKQGHDLKALGQVIIADHLQSLEVLILTMFLVLIGSGAIVRKSRVGE